MSPDLPVHDLPGLIALVKANPDKYSYGSWATGSSAHLTMEWLKKQTGMKTEHVAYRTSSQLLTELSSGVLKIGWTDPSVAVPFLQSGKVRGIAIVGNVRSPQLADVKTMGEQGYKFSTVGWFGMFAPAGTSPAIVKRLADEGQQGAGVAGDRGPDEETELRAASVKSSAQLGEIVRNDLQVWTKIANDAGIRLEE
ncbi:Bug family tripartite tricarboxylate transporter substrate binding protein [Cupriavidus basilensis]